MHRSPWLIAAVLLVPCFCLADDAKVQSEAAELVTHAAVRQGIRHSGEKPYILKIHFHTEHIVPKPMDGQYQEVWASPDKWRRELVLSGFKQVEIGSADAKWVSRNLDFNPRPAYLVSMALHSFTEPKLSADEKVTSIHKRKNKGAELRCVELSRVNNGKRELCFDDAGELVSEEYLKERFEFQNFGTYRDKIYSRTIRVYADDTKVLDITAEDLVPPADLSPELFQADAGALQFASCERWPVSATKKIQPQYPKSAGRRISKGL